MSDLERGDLGGPANTAFKEAYAAAERQAAEAAGLVDETVEPLRDEQGKFAAAETGTVDTEAVADAEAPDERDARILALEARLAEKEAFIGRQSSEIGELRQTVEERLASVDERLNRPAHRQITSDLIDQNPAAATQLAYEQNDTAALAAAYEVWSDMAPAAASAWVSEQRANERETQLRADYDRKIAEIEGRFTPIQQSSDDAQLASAVRALPEDTKAFLTAPEFSVLAQEFPTIGRTVVSGSPRERVEAVRALHDIHRGRTADTLTRTAQDVAREQADAAQAARDDAYVSSSTASQEQPKSLEEREQERMTAIFAAKSAADFGGGLVRPGK